MLAPCTAHLDGLSCERRAGTIPKPSRSSHHCRRSQERRRVKLLCSLEMFSNGHAHFDTGDSSPREHWLKEAQSPNGSFVERFRLAARTYQPTFLAGCPFLKPFNSARLIGRNGHTILRHPNVYICNIDSPEIACGRGKEFSVADETAVGSVKLSLMICMDREYPEAARSLSRAGVEIALVPNCCPLVADDVVGDIRIAQMRGRAFVDGHRYRRGELSCAAL